MCGGCCWVSVLRARARSSGKKRGQPRWARHQVEKEVEPPCALCRCAAVDARARQGVEGIFLASVRARIVCSALPYAARKSARAKNKRETNPARAKGEGPTKRERERGPRPPALLAPAREAVVGAAAAAAVEEKMGRALARARAKDGARRLH